MNDDSFDQPPKEDSLRPTGTPQRGWWTVLAAAAVLVLVLIGIRQFRQTSLEPVDRARFDAARKRWDESRIAGYNIEIQVSGRQAATYYVEVRQGEVQTARHNGNDLHRLPSTWTVPGMFYTVNQDVQNQERVASGKADSSTLRLHLLGRFHPQYGYPERYLRIERVARGANPEVTWVVNKFEIID